MIAVLDLGIGNLSSVRSGFARAGADTIVVETSEMWNQLAKDTIDGVVLPGVGAFGDAMFQLRATGLMQVVKKAAKQGLPVLGICLGMQLLCSISEEHGSHIGLGLIPGRIVRFKGPEKVPHMGWNDFVEVASHPLLKGVEVGDYVYFVHSYYAQMHADEHLLAAAQYGDVRVPAVIGKDNVCGTQFHPEKSGEVGEQILRNFSQMCSEFRQSEVYQ
ncbi:imidazole glycerol phosphate synthase subunit HisH [Alicyclobacillus sp. SO9]|uniref:imidazole glycerol phosphate synthase subunit HisH n=1 Tax=Alicyclobacillus sp. SO9 TaxID=2665646 RepID=UPI0018E8B64B|nr:imidazole glycerol phosphate synthase subunit HisH [Alicyclobacillus sp. SO9]QQE80201.1 imidazole glycerol phosphate synthase subunit HisH [Alicyclobacillus sp. SO9]